MNPSWAQRLSGGAPAELVARVVRLAASDWVTPERVRQAVAACLDDRDPSVDDVVMALESAATAAGRLAGEDRTNGAAAALLDHNAAVHIADTAGYPARVQQAWPELGAPLWMFVQSPDGTLPSGAAVAVVGTRHPTLDGLRTAREIAQLLGRNGVTVVSGMARGIDQAAHLGAIDAGGRTTGVLGTGFGVDYPSRDGPVRNAVAASGGLVSELLPGTPPMKPSFLWRNRIIAALADVTVVVEGRSGSGALHTARMAAAQGRDVLAVPGPVRAPTSRAPLELIRDGAQAMTRLDDVLEVLGRTPEGAVRQQQHDVVDLGPAAQQVLPLLGAVPASPGTLAAATAQPVAAVLAAVAELTARGLAVPTPRGVVRGST